MDMYEVISQIAERACVLRPELDHVSVMMDLECVHERTPLDLERLLGADDFNVMHDVIGINNCLNRETRKLERCFVPRFTV